MRANPACRSVPTLNFATGLDEFTALDRMIAIPPEQLEQLTALDGLSGHDNPAACGPQREEQGSSNGRAAPIHWLSG